MSIQKKCKTLLNKFSKQKMPRTYFLQHVFASFKFQIIRVMTVGKDACILVYVMD